MSEPVLRFQVSADATGAPRVTSIEPPKTKSRKRPVEVRRGSVTVRIYKTKWWDKKRKRYYHSNTIVYVDSRGEHRHKIADDAKAKSRAEKIATDLLNGETALLNFSQADQASFLRCQELLHRAGITKPIELVIAEMCELRQVLGEVPPLVAGRYYSSQHPNGVAPRNIPEIVTELFEKRHMGPKWKRVLSKMLDRFATHFTGPASTLRARDIDDWLDALKDKSGEKIGLRTRRNYREAIATLINFAKARGYLPSEWNALESVSDPEPAAVQVRTYTPEELLALLATAEKSTSGSKLVPFICITAFAGIRHGEINEEKARLLDWSDFDFEGKEIQIDSGSAKTKAGRVVDIPDNLAEWLKPYVRPTGRVCSLRNTSNALCRLRAKAARELLDEAAKCANQARARELQEIAERLSGPKKNALRKSFITYKKAITRDVTEVADQAGNSPGIIRKNYLRTGTGIRRIAERWFALRPVRADVLPLFSWKTA